MIYLDLGLDIDTNIVNTKSLLTYVWWSLYILSNIKQHWGWVKRKGCL